ncbi:MAG: hypothetical protein HYY54_00355, partial [candidate division NC10 bacterium]|nr:hypothetical protein [candidate division NC10 bacterium]
LLLAERLPGGLTGRRLGWYRFVVDAGFVAGPVGFTALVDAAGFGAAGLAGTVLGAAALLVAAASSAPRSPGAGKGA